MNKKITSRALIVMLFALSFPVEAQQPARIPRIGYLAGFGNPNNPGPQVEAFRQGLRELGYIEGKNLLVEYRYVEEAGSCPKFGRGASATQSGYAGHSTYRSDLRSQAGDQGDFYRNGD